jgi:hypothetical protein
LVRDLDTRIRIRNKMSRIHNTGYSNLKSCKINIGLLSLACTYRYQISSPVYSRVFQQEGKEVGTVQHVDIVVHRYVIFTFLIYPSSGQLRDRELHYCPEQKYSPDVVARDGLVAAHPDDGLRDEGSIPGQLSDGELFARLPGLLNHRVQGLH